MVSNRDAFGRALGLLSARLEIVLASKWFFWSEAACLAGFAALAAHGYLVGMYSSGQWALVVAVLVFWSGAGTLTERGLRQRLSDTEAMANKMGDDAYNERQRANLRANLLQKYVNDLKNINLRHAIDIHSLHWELERLRGVFLTSVTPKEAFTFHPSEFPPAGFTVDQESWDGQWVLDGVSEDRKTAWVKSVSSGYEQGMRVRSTTRVVRVNEPDFYAPNSG